ncbi:hypothetical protein H8N03_19215 [Ramlibacter sp. USB13]|uniref:Uncharacterized protein n=1 Tax=Ramlibacter cellulosilyticus TaxID=2764187 RepID=A0A923MTV4_9BURK|nr:hypothetical protein [Ramlibacter cellulosilyticus]MBC5785085.1 hypothetical protein [Ramlibacter cellulosilyticus]
MQSTLRTRLAAAAMLLVPVGALVAAQPAAAQHRDRDGDRYHSQRFDRRAPDIFDVTPDQGDRVSERGLTRIAARFSDDRSGVDPRTVTLRVDGRDVTRHARVDGNDIRYADNLRPGRHFAEVLVRDRAGNLARRSWAFNVVDRDFGRYGYGYGRNR